MDQLPATIKLHHMILDPLIIFLSDGIDTATEDTLKVEPPHMDQLKVIYHLDIYKDSRGYQQDFM